MFDQINQQKPPYAMIAGFTLVIIGVRLHLVSNLGSHVPYWDDWMLGFILELYQRHGFDSDLVFFSTSNQHRWIFTKLLNIGLYELNNHQWDPLLPMIFNAVLWGGTGAGLITIAYRCSTEVNAHTLSFFILILWTFPLSLFNALSTIQSMNYFMIWFVLMGCWMVTSRAYSWVWWVGMLFLAAGGLSYAGGILAPIAVTVGCIILWYFSDASYKRQHRVTALFAGAISIFSVHHLFFYSTSGSSKAISLEAFLISLIKTLSWPLSEHMWPALIFILPIVLLGLQVFKHASRHPRLFSFTLFLAGFSLILAVAIAYSRGYAGIGPAGRYYEFMAIYLLANLLALLLLNTGKYGVSLRYARSLSLIWVICVGSSSVTLYKAVSFMVEGRAKLVPAQEQVVSDYVLTKDDRVFRGKKDFEVPFPHKDQLSEFLDKADAGNLLPYQFQRRGMAVAANQNVFTVNGFGATPGGKYRGHENVLGSYNLEHGAQHAKGKYISEVFTADRPFVMIPTLGYLGYPGTSLKLVGENNKDEKVIPDNPEARFANHWKETLVPVPDSRYRIHAVDDSDSIWFAYAAPRSVGRLSYYAHLLLSNAHLIWQFGVLLLVLLNRNVLFSLFSPRLQTRR
jgi:hypothetical protein